MTMFIESGVFLFWGPLLGREGIGRRGRPVLQVHADGAVLFESASPNPGLLAASMSGFRHTCLICQWLTWKSGRNPPRLSRKLAGFRKFYMLLRWTIACLAPRLQAPLLLANGQEIKLETNLHRYCAV